MDPSGPSITIVFGCLCIAPVIAVLCVIMLVWLARRSREKLPVNAIVTCPACGREMPQIAAACPHCGQRR
ncbi:MAG: hypothetical protein ACR2FY_18665 [Pirellulaceae bacterium]